MNLVADESVDRSIVERLRLDGHAVVYVAEVAASISDESVLGLANGQHALLVTADKDFGELAFRLHKAVAGIVLLRLGGLSATSRTSIVVASLRQTSELRPGDFMVIGPGYVRIRRRQA